MGYAIAQLRKQSGSNTYMETIQVTPTTFRSPNKFASDEMSDTDAFMDFGLSGTFQQGETYYLRFIMHRIPQGFYSRRFKGQYGMYKNADDMTFTLLLKNKLQEDEENIPPQILDTFTINSLTVSETEIGANTIYYSYVAVFTPVKTYDLLGFRLARTAYDILNPTAESKSTLQPWVEVSSGPAGQRLWLFGIADTVQQTVFDDSGQTYIVETTGDRIIYQNEKGDIAKLKNITAKSSAAGSKSDTWIKFGFQSRPGTLIVVNKEPIRVGRSGIYQINNGTLITNFMITAPQGSDNTKIDAFLLDYAYNS